MSPDDGKSVACVQSNYIPWKGYFDLIASVDEFIFLDDAQYTKRGWRNRNRIKTPQGPVWLTVPVRVKGRYEQRIDETELAGEEWADKHFESLRHAYGRAPHFDDVAPMVREVYASECTMLSDLNQRFIREICAVLGIGTRLVRSTDYDASGRGDARLVSLCQEAGATAYLSGPTAAHRLDESLFTDVGVSVSYMDYDGYPEYDQLYPPFVHEVTVLDLLFHTGAQAPSYMKVGR